MSVWWLYLIRCKNNTLYTGITTDVKRRFSEHQSGTVKSAKYLRGKGPLELVYHSKVGNRSEASIAEYNVKKLSRANKDQLIDGSLMLSSITSTQ
jgi:putative endonuclease